MFFLLFLPSVVTNSLFVRHICEGGEKVTDFQEVYDLYFRDVYRYALSLCRNETIAEELQDLYDLDNFNHIYNCTNNIIYIVGIKHLINYLIYILRMKSII